MAKKKKAVENVSTEQPTVVVHGFKGFDKNWKCRGMQYVPGETYEEAEAKLCENGLHFCEHPLDCLGYYAPGEGSRYAEVTADNPTDEKSDDTKRVTKKLHIGAELSLGGLVDAAVKFVFDRAEWTEADKATGYKGAASATGDYGAASATGYYGAASATGNYGAASATGDQGAASATDYKGAASATGYKGAASATGYYGAASATGDYGAASATGNYGAASATGDQGAASATGYKGAASATGNESVAMACGYEGKARASVGSWIVLTERDDEGHILCMQCAKVDGNVFKPDVYYMLKNGEIIEA